MAKLYDRVFVHVVIPFQRQLLTTFLKLHHQQLDAWFFLIQLSLNSLLKLCKLLRNLLFHLFVLLGVTDLALFAQAINAVELTHRKLFDYLCSVTRLLYFFVAEILAFFFLLMIPGPELPYLLLEIVVELLLKLELLAEKVLHIRVLVNDAFDEVHAGDVKHSDHLGVGFERVLPPLVLENEVLNACQFIGCNDRERHFLRIFAP